MLIPTTKNMLNSIVAHENKLSVILLNEMNYACTSGYNGFKRFFRYRAMDRQRHAIMLCNFTSEYLQDEIDIAVTIPSVSASTGLIPSFASYKVESDAQITRLKAAINTAVNDGEHLLSSYLNMLLEDQSEEVMCVNKIILSLNIPGVDVRCFDQEIDEEYEEMEKEKFGFQSPKLYK